MLVLSDVYWQWIFELLSSTTDDEGRLPFVKAFEEGFDDPSNLVERLPVSLRVVETFRRIEPTLAPSFERVVPSKGCIVPSAERILAELQTVISEAVDLGSVEMEIG
ncbi:MAG: hypothetical protein R3B13_37990 [Polyangiaceae bacterium]